MNKQPQPSKTWTSNLSDEKEREEFISRLLSNKDLFQRLLEIVEVKNKDNARKRRANNSYEKPAWAESQADANGYERALTEVQDLLKFTKE